VSRRLAVLLVGALAACASSAKLQQNAQVIHADLDKARKSGAARCAPRELALAEVHVDIAESAIANGDGDAAEDHLAVAERNTRKALDFSKDCAPAQVTIAKKESPAIVIEKLDRDGDGVPDAEDLCPDDPGPPENHGCPIVKDSDGDGIPDDIDRCPLDPEDKDGFQDEDGCPDPDNDKDGIVDLVDACPNNPGPLENRGCPIQDRDGDGIPDWADKCPDVPGLPPDGCPKKYALVEVRKERIEIKQQIHFAYAKARVLPDSYPLLNQVVQVLRDLPGMRVSIEGHTDSTGPAAHNLRLSQLRAEAVRDYLVKKGVAADRLQTMGFGPTKPIASNKTEKGRAKNRRTEFRILTAI
jgi:OOP family OmpA-OmpF porin